MNEQRFGTTLLIVVMALGAYLRLVDLGGPSLWLDEILHVSAAESFAEQPWHRYVFGPREIGGATENGSLYYGLQVLGQYLAPGDVGARLFPALIGVLTLPLMAWVGHRLGGALLSLIATFLLAVSPLHVYFSREGRPYALLMALALIFLLALLEGPTRRGLGIAAAGCAAAAYVGLHVVPIVASLGAVAGLRLLGKLVGEAGSWRGPGPSGTQLPLEARFAVVPLLALGLIWGLYMTSSDLNDPTRIRSAAAKTVQTEVEASSWFKAPLSAKSQGLFVASMTTSGHPSISTEARSWALVALALIGIVALVRRRPGDALATVGMFVLPAALSILTLVAVGRWYDIRYTSAALPAFLLLTAAGIAALANAARVLIDRWQPEPRRPGVEWLAAGLAAAILVAPNIEAARDDPQRKLDWRGIAAFVDSIMLEDEAILVPNAWPKVCLDYYLEQLGRSAEFVMLWESVDTAQREAEQRRRGWLLTAGFQRSGDVRAWMHNFTPVLTHQEEEMALFFFPDFATLFETRFAAGKGQLFEGYFAERGGRFEFARDDGLLLGRGWALPEVAADGLSFQWIMGAEAQLGVPVSVPREARLRFRAMPFGYPNAPDQDLALWLNDEPLGVVDIPAGWSQQEVVVPATAWHSGANLLTLRPTHQARPADVLPGNDDRRELGVALDSLEVLF